MSKNDKIMDFNDEHPWPRKAGVTSLYKFIRIDWSKKCRLDHLLIHAKLYQAHPTELNDPFECKPQFVWPLTGCRAAKIRAHLIKSAKKIGIKKKSAEKRAAKAMSNPDSTEKIIRDAITRNYANLRICSFTETKENLLCWSHYANSHTGICVEFDATVLPISYAYKVKYLDDYPEIQYPHDDAVTAFRPALTKSKEWEYEQEYRIIFVPGSSTQPNNDGESLVLKGNEITNIYFGANMKNDDKKRLMELVENGPFRPKFWHSRISNSKFVLDFEEANLGSD
jgi:hypothetical protein